MSNETQQSTSSVTMDQASVVEALTGGEEEEWMRRVRSVLTHQLDVEILHKWREIRVIEEELERGRQLQTLIEKLVMNDFVYGGEGTASVTSQSARSTPLAYSSDNGGSPGRRATRSLSHLSIRDRPQTEPQAQYEVRPDGTIVRMRCPKCGADKFRSMLGFLNHCRIHCRLTFFSQDDRLQRCGVIIDPSEVPHDYFNKHPTQLKQEMDLALIRADVLGPVNDFLKRPMIHIEEDGGGNTGTTSIGNSGESYLFSKANRDEQQLWRYSRYYVRKSVIVGNSAKSLLTKNGLVRSPEEKLSVEQGPSESEGKRPTHKWRIHVKSPKTALPWSPDDVRSFVKAIRFFLHPSYRPNDVVDILSPPFELVRTGWGEFPIRIQLHFWDPRNKPVELVHLLRVLPATSGKYMTMAEQIHELDLDRHTNFSLGLANEGEAVTLPLLESRVAPISEDDVLMMAISDFPLIGQRGRRATGSRYRPLASLEDFLRMDISQQRQHEMQRANALCNHLMTVFPTFSLSVEDVIRWCREKGFTPASVVSFVAALEQTTEISANLLMYCRFCGLAHLPQDKFEILQRNCSMRPRKVHVSSRTPSYELLNRFDLLSENSDIVKRLKQECFGPNFMPYYPPSEVITTTTATSSLVTTTGSPVSGGSNHQSGGESISEFGSTGGAAEVLENWTSLRIQELHLSHYHPRASITIKTIQSAMCCFLGNLINCSLAELPDNKERSNDRPVLLTPLHIYRAITSQPDLDFIANTHMLGGAQPPKGPV